jgi:Na+/melibiose symporter-like transporter
MRPFQKPYQTKPTEPHEDDPSESLGNAVFWGVLIWVVVISVPAWFIIVDEKGKSSMVNIALTIVVIDLMCAWLVAAMIKKWFNRKNLVVAISLCLLAGATYLWFIDQRIWAVSIALVVCTTDTILGIKALAEGWLSHYDDDDRRERGP